MKFSHAARLTRLRFGLLAAVLAVVGLFAATAQIASASPSRAATGPKPTIVLEHGAWADSGSWNGVVQRLQHDGYTVYAPPDPLQGLAYDTATLKDFLGTIPGPIVLVGHSYGGMVITNAATGNKNVKALVYDDAFIPAQGDTAGSLSGARPGSCLAVANPATVFNLVPFPGAPKGVVDAYVKPSVFPGCFANGLPASEGAVLAATQRPLATSVLTDKSGVPAWKTIPSWAIVGTADHVIPPAEQLFMAKRAGAHITEVHAPHLSMISNPGVVTETIIAAAQATG
ncbi:MAG TPA: alpha/beta hydrolase [Streptosporangiaceae bacterium]|nr:alpha/beta hydrolase [Streptosporangiaceae bacterium]